MKDKLAVLWGVLSSRALPPLVLGFFLLLYIGIAFFTEETLTVLIALTGKYPLLAAVLGLLPLNCACRLLVEAGRFFRRRRPLAWPGADADPALYDETLDIEAPRGLADLEGRLRAAGYRCRKGGEVLVAWRGATLSPARIIFLAAAFCLFAGILVSVTSRKVYRQAIVEGEQFEAPSGVAGVARRIVLKESTGPILLKELVMEVAGEGGRGSGTRFGVYPPTLFGGAFAYPRYLGIALDYRLTGPGLPEGQQRSAVLPLYPPGKEASAPVAGSPYKVALTLAKPDDGSDPYMTGRMLFDCKLLKDGEVLFAGTLPKGGELFRDGYRLALPDARRMVITDFVVDYGVLLIWGAGLLFLLALSLWLPLRLFFPRREMLFSSAGGAVRAFSRAEGRARAHAGVFHEVLDFIAASRSAARQMPE